MLLLPAAHLATRARQAALPNSRLAGRRRALGEQCAAEPCAAALIPLLFARASIYELQVLRKETSNACWQLPLLPAAAVALQIICSGLALLSEWYAERQCDSTIQRPTVTWVDWESCLSPRAILLELWSSTGCRARAPSRNVYV